MRIIDEMLMTLNDIDRKKFNSRNDKDVEVIRPLRWDPHTFKKHLNSSTLVILVNICEALCHVTQNLHKMSHVTSRDDMDIRDGSLN